MIEISFSLPVKPISINNAYYRNRQYTQKTRLYREQFLLLLQSQEVQSKFNLIKEAFNPLEHGLEVEYTFFHPYDILYKKSDGSVSSRSFDLTNIEKLPQDFLFNSKYLSREVGDTEISNLGIDDKYILSMHSSKKPSTDGLFSFLVLIRLIPKGV